MRKILILLAVGASLSSFAQHHGKSRNPYDINYSAAELASKLSEPKISLFEGILSGVEVEFTTSVNRDMKGISLLVFPPPGMIMGDEAAPKYYTIRARNDRYSVTSGRIQRVGSTQFFVDISGLPKGNYVLMIDELQTGQPITFSNY